MSSSQATWKGEQLMASSTAPTKIFSYDELKKKAHREIERLANAEEKMDETSAIDHALNAAFTIFHLLEWREKTNNPLSETGARTLAKSADKSLQILHDIVTCNKHVKIKREFHTKNPNVHYDEKLDYITAENEIPLLTEDGEPLLTEDSRIIVNFDSAPASDILKTALKEFN